MPTVEVSTNVNAPAARVWDLIGDPTRMGEWSPECERVSWRSGRRSPAVGAKFIGHNRLGNRRWFTFGRIVRLEPGREIAWDVAMVVPIARWGLRIDDAPEGCTLTECFDDRRGRLAKALGKPVRGVTDVESHNRAGMAATLDRIKRAAEGV